MALYQKNQPESIEKLFDNIAKKYDTANGLMSFQLHRRWNQQLVNAIIQNQKIDSYLDLCSGTGEIAFRLLARQKEPIDAYLLDFSEGMLECAKKKAPTLPMDHHNINYIKGDAQRIPLADTSVNAVTIAYGIRNVKSPEACIKEAYRVLKPGGVFGILELTRPKNMILRFGHNMYLKTALPLIGKCFVTDRDAYQYLSDSINTFVDVETLNTHLLAAGFSKVTTTSFFGGVATHLVSRK